MPMSDARAPTLVRVIGEVETALPTGGATSANQTTANSSLSTIATAVAAATPAGENHIGEVGGKTAIVVGSTTTRVADTNVYASGDLVANSTTAGSVTAGTASNAVRVSAGTGMIRKMRLRKSNTSITNASFRVHLFTAAPTVTNGDNGVLIPSTISTYIGALDVSTMMAFGDGAVGNGAPVVGSELNFQATTTTIYYLIEARGAYTPASAETFIPVFEILQN